MSDRDPPPHLLHAFSTFEVGGQQTRFLTLANGFRGKFRHTVVAMDNRFASAERLDKGLDCTVRDIKVTKTASISLGNLARFRGLLRSLRPDLLLTYNWGAVEWALANRWRPLCRHLHFEDGFGPDESPNRQNWKRVLMRRLALSGVTRVIVPSRTLYDLATGTWQLSPDRVIHVPNGIDCRRFAQPSDAALAERFGLQRPGLVIGTVAALRAEKNLSRLVRAVAALPREIDYRLVIVGEGPERDAILAAARALGTADRLILTGAIDRPERLLGRFDVFALSSDTEQMPYSVLEAMAAGLPVVATDVGDVRRILSSENAPFVVPREEERSFTKSLLQLLRDGELRGRVGARNQSHARENYGLDLMMVRYESLFSGMG